VQTQGKLASGAVSTSTSGQTQEKLASAIPFVLLLFGAVALALAAEEVLLMQRWHAGAALEWPFGCPEPLRDWRAEVALLASLRAQGQTDAPETLRPCPAPARCGPLAEACGLGTAGALLVGFAIARGWRRHRPRTAAQERRDAIVGMVACAAWIPLAQLEVRALPWTYAMSAALGAVGAVGLASVITAAPRLLANARVARARQVN
jgi:hypothetical protein